MREQRLSPRTTALSEIRETALWTVSRHVRNPLNRSGYLLTANAISGAGFGFLYWLVIARLFTPGDVGVGTAILSAATVIGGLCSMGLGIGLIRYLNQAPKGRGDGLISASYLLVGCLSAIVGALYLAGTPIWSPGLVLQLSEASWSAAFIGGVFVMALSGVNDQVLLAHRSGTSVLIRNIIMHLLRLVLPFVFSAAGGIVGVYASSTIAVGISTLFGVWLLVSIVRPTYRLRLQPKLVEGYWGFLRFSIGSHVGSYLLNAPQYVMPIIIVNALSPAEAAQYYVAWLAASMVYSLANSFAMAAFVEGSAATSSVSPIVKAAGTVTVILLPFAATLYILAPSILRVFGDIYVEATGVMRLLILISPLSASSRFVIAYWRVKGNVGLINAFGALFAVSAISVAQSSSTLGGFGVAYAVAYSVCLLFSLGAIAWERSRT